jgi:multidrug efflux pump subunit AcrA (membrane-fusion protein)
MNITNRIKSIFNIFTALSKTKKITAVSLLLMCISAVTLFVYAGGEHAEEASTSTTESKKVIIRQVGDTDPDAISQEGTGSFFGTIISKDISSVHPPREGVISSWNVSVGDYVSLGDVLGYVTVTGISPEQQALLVEQQTNAFKAQLDAETANAVALESETVFGKVISNFKAITDKQKSVYSGNSGTSSSAYLTELKTLQNRQVSLENKLQDFGNTVILSIFPLVSRFGQSPFNQGYTDVSVKFEVGTKNSSLRSMYVELLRSYATKTSSRSLTEADVQDFLNKTNQIMESYLALFGVHLRW